MAVLLKQKELRVLHQVTFLSNLWPMCKIMGQSWADSLTKLAFAVLLLCIACKKISMAYLFCSFSHSFVLDKTDVDETD